MTVADTHFLYKLANELESYYVDSGGLGMGGVYGCIHYPFREQAKEIRAYADNQPNLRNHVVNLLPYAHMLLNGKSPLAAYSDILPYVIKDAEKALKSS